MKAPTYIVAIDGPAGAGKSAVAKEVAKRLNLNYLDTGAMYRAATWWAMKQGIDLDDPEATAVSTKRLPLEMREENGLLKVFVDGQDVSDAIRSPEVTRTIYKLDQNPRIRNHMVRLQQEFGAQRPTIAEGRDIGTVVFPKAACKIYMDASIEVRAQRRARELEAKGHTVDLAVLKKEIHERDEKDRHRTMSPLKCAEDAVRVDTTSKTFEEVIELVMQLARDAQ